MIFKTLLSAFIVCVLCLESFAAPKPIGGTRISSKQHTRSVKRYRKKSTVTCPPKAGVRVRENRVGRNSRHRNIKLSAGDLTLELSDYHKSELRELEVLRNLHMLQMRLLSEKNTLSEKDRKRISREIRSATRDLKELFSDVKGFPYYGKFQVMNDVVAEIHRSQRAEFKGLSQEEILSKIQKQQQKVVQAFIDEKALNRKVRRLNN